MSNNSKIEPFEDYSEMQSTFISNYMEMEDPEIE